MCATFNIDKTTLERYSRGLAGAPTVRPGGDVFPSDTAVILTLRGPQLCEWGFSISGKKGAIINARAETVEQRPMFSQSFMSRRCVVPSNGFYEWDAQKRKRLFVPTNGATLFLCGFYRNENGRDKFVVLTKQSTPPVDLYHDRIPVIAADDQARNYIKDTNFACDFICSDTDFLLCNA